MAFRARNAGGMMGGQRLPFDVDPSLEDDIQKYQNQVNKQNNDPTTSLFPPYPGGVPRAPPLTKAEKEKMRIWRELLAKKHAGPSYSGPPGTLAKLLNKKNGAADFNPFEDQQTYGKRFERKVFILPDPKKRKWQAPHLFPKELWETIGYNPDGDDNNQPKKKLALSNSNIRDKLAKFDENLDERGVTGDVDDEDEELKGDDDDEAEPELQDDEYDEDEEDDNNDYNAEQYFDGGEEEYDEAAGDEYGDDGY